MAKSKMVRPTIWATPTNIRKNMESAAIRLRPSSARDSSASARRNKTTGEPARPSPAIQRRPRPALLQRDPILLPFPERRGITYRTTIEPRFWVHVMLSGRWRSTLAAGPSVVQDRQNHALEVLPVDLRAQCVDIFDDAGDYLAPGGPQRHAVSVVRRQQLADIEKRVDRVGALAQPFRL